MHVQPTNLLFTAYKHIHSEENRARHRDRQTAGERQGPRQDTQSGREATRRKISQRQIGNLSTLKTK